MRIIVVANASLEVVRERLVSGLRAAGCDVVWLPSWSAVHDPNSGLSHVDIVVGAGTCPIFSAIVDVATRLRAVVAVGSGTEGFDRALAAQHTVIIGYGPTAENSESMAEATILLMLALSYRLKQSERFLREGVPGPRQPARTLRHRTVGLIGFGRIGRSVARKLSTWDARVQVYGPRLDPASIPSGVALVDFGTLLRTSDIVSVHVALNDQTRKMLGAEQLESMKPGALLVNTARGGIVDETALARLLTDGHLGGAALDVFATLPLPADHPLRQAPNTILTPHQLGHTRDNVEAAADTVIANVARIARGEAPLHTRNPEILPAWTAKWAGRPLGITSKRPPAAAGAKPN